MRPSSRLSLPSADNPDQINLDAAAVNQQSGCSDRGPRRRCLEEILPDLVEREEVGKVGQEHLRLYHLIQRAAGRFEGVLQVVEDVAGLFLDRGTVIGERG